jgi:CelD/BcsL family acetyltransferase involved in cellulose biosynthesis
MAVTWEVLDSVEAVEPTVVDWDRLATAANLPYCAPAWGLAWFRHAAPTGTRLRVVAVRDGDRLVGLGPFYAEPWRAGLWTWSLLGTEISSRIEPLAAPGQEDAVAGALAEAIASGTPAPARIELNGLPVDSPWPEALKAAWPGRRPYHHREPPTPAPVVPLEGGDLDGWLGTRSSNFRQQMRRTRRKLEKDGFTFRTSSTPEEVDRDLEAFQRLHNARWDDRGGSAALTPGTDRMLAEAGRGLIPEQRFQLISLEREGQVVNSQLFLAAGNEISYWNGGFDDDFASYKPSIVGLVEAVRASLEQGYERFDLGPGAQEYKNRFTDQQDEVVWQTLIPPGRTYTLARALFAPRQAKKGIAERLTPEQKQRLKRFLRRGEG